MRKLIVLILISFALIGCRTAKCDAYSETETNTKKETTA